MFTLLQTLDFWWASKNFFFQLKKAFEQVVKKLLKIVQKRSQKKCYAFSIFIQEF